MSKARLVLTALIVEHQTPAEVAARYGVHRAWVYKLKARYQAEGRRRSNRGPDAPTAHRTRPRNPTRDYQPTGAPKGPTRNHP